MLPTEVRDQDTAWVREGLQFHDSLSDFAGGSERGESVKTVGDFDPDYFISVWETCLLPATGIVFYVVCLAADTNQFLDIVDVRSGKVISRSALSLRFSRIIFPHLGHF